MALFVSLVIPAYNEESNLETCVKEAVKALDALGEGYEIIIAEDGSRDSTLEIAEKLASKNKRIRILHSGKRLGRGESLKRAIRSARGRIVAYIDSDLATSLKHLKPLLEGVENGAAISTGSRLLPQSTTTRSQTRDIASKGYNLLVRLLLRSRLSDHQCGFKAFNRKKIIPLLEEVKDNHWFWDTEMLVRAQRKKLSVYEFPVEWRESSDSKVNLLKDVLDMGSKVVLLAFS